MPRYIDITAELMGDPQASERRAPTEAEKTKCEYNKWEGRIVRNHKANSWRFWSVGETRAFDTAAKAKKTRDQVQLLYGHVMVRRITPDGKHTVTRIS